MSGKAESLGAAKLAEQHAQRVVMLDEVARLVAVLGIELSDIQRVRLADYRGQVLEQRDAALRLAEADRSAATHVDFGLLGAIGSRGPSFESTGLMAPQEARVREIAREEADAAVRRSDEAAMRPIP